MTAQIHRSATREQQILIDQAFEDGIAKGIEMSIALLEAHGHRIGAQRLREAKIVEVEAANDLVRTGSKAES